MGLDIELISISPEYIINNFEIDEDGCGIWENGEKEGKYKSIKEWRNHYELESIVLRMFYNNRRNDKDAPDEPNCFFRLTQDNLDYWNEQGIKYEKLWRKNCDNKDEPIDETKHEFRYAINEARKEMEKGNAVYLSYSK